MNHPPREHPFLQHPAATVQRSELDVLVEVVNRWAHVNSPGCLGGQWYTLPVVAGTKKAIRRRFSGAGTDCAVCVAENLLHFCCFLLPVVRIILDDTQRVDPDKVYAKALGDENGIPECSGELFDVNRLLKAFDVAS